MTRLIATLKERKVVAAALLTAITLALVAAVTLTTTSLGCRVGIKTANRCATPVAANPGFTPFATPFATAPNPQPTFFPNPNPDPNPPAASPSYPPAPAPYNPPATAGAPPYNPPASGPYPPFGGGPASGLGGPAFTFSCRLPVYAGGPGSGGFVVFPGGTFVADPGSSVTAPSPSPGSASPAPQGPGYGYPNGWWGTTYDRAYSRWLPVPRSWVTPDGTRYAYPGADGVYVQDIVKGTNVELGSGRAWSVLDVESEGVYAVAPQNAGLWLLPFAGSATQVTTVGYWQAIAGGFAYGTETSAVPQGATTTIIKLDLQSHATTPWFSRAGAQSSVIGFDGQGHPVIAVNGPGASETWIATSPTSGILLLTYIYQPYPPAGFQPSGPVVADSHGLWFTGNGGIALFVASSGWYWMASLGAQVAGTCV